MPILPLPTSRPTPSAGPWKTAVLRWFRPLNPPRNGVVEVRLTGGAVAWPFWGWNGVPAREAVKLRAEPVTFR